MSGPKQTVTVCLCTFRRPEMLRRALEGIAALETRDALEVSIVVVDNDRAASAQGVVKSFQASAPLAVSYFVEEEQNIARARNKALAHATGDFVAFIDDDEVPDPQWLVQSWETCREHDATGVLGPVRPSFSQKPPAWVVRGRFCERPEHATGHVLQWRETRTGNAFLRRTALADLPGPFRTEFANGGEDQDFFRRLMERGGRFVWCQEAVVHEEVPCGRLTRSYMLRRALLRGQNERHLTNLGGLLKSMVAIPVYALVLPLSLLLGQHHFMKYLIRTCDHAGKLVGFLGFKPMGEKYLGA